MKRLTILFVMTVIMVILYGQIDYTVAPFTNWDLAYYREMASASPRIATSVCQPPAYRVLGPWLAGLLPVPDPDGFYALSVLASIVLVFLLYYFFRTNGLSPSASVITVVLYTFSRFFFGLTVWDFFQINDLLTQIWIVVLFLAMMKGRWMIFGATLFLGALTRETSMLMIPVAAVYLWERKGLRHQGKQALVAILPGLAIFLLLRNLIPAPCGMSLFEQLQFSAGYMLLPEKHARLLINSFLPFSFIPLVFFEITLQYFKTRLYALLFVTFVYFSLLFSLSWDERLMAPASVVFYTLIGYVIKEHQHEKTFLAVLIGGGFLSSLHHLVARYPLPDRIWTMVFSLGSLLVVTAVAIAIRLKRGHPRQEGEISAPLDSAA